MNKITSIIAFLIPINIFAFPPYSPYTYCMGDPINKVDPSGKSTCVVMQSDSTFVVKDGALDGDLNIYLCTYDSKGNLIKGEAIGQTPVETSFYNSDTGEWMKEAIIDPNDKSGERFILNSTGDNTPGLAPYALNARGGQYYDFKKSNGTKTTSDDGGDMYRGMPVPINNGSDLPTYSSARDIGNMVAGYVAGYNGLPWFLTRAAFDGLQSAQEHKPATEGASSQNAQRFGYNWGKQDRKYPFMLFPGRNLFKR